MKDILCKRNEKIISTAYCNHVCDRYHVSDHLEAQWVYHEGCGIYAGGNWTEHHFAAILGAIQPYECFHEWRGMVFIICDVFVFYVSVHKKMDEKENQYTVTHKVSAVSVRGIACVYRYDLYNGLGKSGL